MSRGYFGIGVWHPKTGVNIGTLLRSAHAMGAAYVFTVGRRYERQSSDTTKAWRHLPLLHFPTLEALVDGLPYSCPLIAVELTPGAKPLAAYAHPERACYLLGAEDHGLPPEILTRCVECIVIEGPHACLNVAVAGSIVMWDRMRKRQRGERINDWRATA